MKIIHFLPAHNKIQFLTNITLYTQLYNVFSGTHLEHYTRISMNKGGNSY